METALHPSTDGCEETPSEVSTKWGAGRRVILVDPKVAIFLPANLPPSHIYIYIHSLNQQTTPGTGAGHWQTRQPWAALPSDLHIHLKPLPLRILPFAPDTH